MGLQHLCMAPWVEDMKMDNEQVEEAFPGPLPPFEERLPWEVDKGTPDPPPHWLTWVWRGIRQQQSSSRQGGSIPDGWSKGTTRREMMVVSANVTCWHSKSG